MLCSYLAHINHAKNVIWHFICSPKTSMVRKDYNNGLESILLNISICNERDFWSD